jgi:DNA topoisomerase I
MLAVADLASVRADVTAAAEAARLRYVHVDEPGYRRRRCGRGFIYLTPAGERLSDETQLARIRSLAIPPAWDEVWICRAADGHIQAVGKDARGRKQYRYHPRWREVRDAAKFEHLVSFGDSLPRLRRRLRRDLKLQGLPRDKVLAAVVRLLDRAYLRIGNERYTACNGSYGLTTLCNRHLAVAEDQLKLTFVGKSGKRRKVELCDSLLAPVLARLQELPGQRLMQYLTPEGEIQTVESGDVNTYLRQVTGVNSSSKDFRTWAATLSASAVLEGLGPGPSQRACKERVKDAVQKTALALGNTPAVCRKSYIHPLILDSYMAGELCDALARHRDSVRGSHPRELSLQEATLLALLAS